LALKSHVNSLLCAKRRPPCREGGWGGADTPAGQIGLHLDGNYRDTDNYKIPGNARQGDSSSASGRLPNSFTHETSLGGGISYVT
ncbi:hypothetical protein, partial [Salmonella enterica]|uniref:hypothetical protein n=1 Tax=Salmonella enterica TaxID=28901 RepID=UPI0020C2AF7C